jgi:hypothetical protein
MKKMTSFQTILIWKMIRFQNREEAEEYGKKNHLRPVIRETKSGKFIVEENYDYRNLC